MVTWFNWLQWNNNSINEKNLEKYLIDEYNKFETNLINNPEVYKLNEKNLEKYLSDELEKLETKLKNDPKLFLLKNIFVLDFKQSKEDLFKEIYFKKMWNHIKVVEILLNYEAEKTYDKTNKNKEIKFIETKKNKSKKQLKRIIN